MQEQTCPGTQHPRVVEFEIHLHFPTYTKHAYLGLLALLTKVYGPITEPFKVALSRHWFNARLLPAQAFQRCDALLYLSPELAASHTSTIKQSPHRKAVWSKVISHRLDPGPINVIVYVTCAASPARHFVYLTSLPKGNAQFARI